MGGLAHVHDAHMGHFLVVHALGEFQQRVLAIFTVVIMNARGQKLGRDLAVEKNCFLQTHEKIPNYDSPL